MFRKKIKVLFIFFIFGFISPVWAINLPYLSPAKIRLSISAGQSKYGEITIENPTSEIKSMHLYLEDWQYVSDASGLKDFFPAGTTSLSCASWINFSPAEIAVPPFGRKKINYSIKVPFGAQGAYYAVLFCETSLGGELGVIKEGMTGAGVTFTVRIGALFYVEIEGTVKRNAEFQKLALKKESASNPLIIELGFRNSSNTDITAGGSYHIMDKTGFIYARGEFNDVYTFPGDSAKFTSTWKEPIPKGKYDLVLTVNIGKAQEEAGLGRGPVIVKEAEIEIGAGGEVVRVGELK